MNKLLERLKTEKIAVNCKTLDQTMRMFVLVFIDDTGEYAFKGYKDKICVDCFCGSKGYAPLTWYQERGYKIVSYDDFMRGGRITFR